jgi:quercetin dioxygenase-like cupin family protein
MSRQILLLEAGGGRLELRQSERIQGWLVLQCITILNELTFDTLRKCSEVAATRFPEKIQDNLRMMVKCDCRHANQQAATTSNNKRQQAQSPCAGRLDQAQEAIMDVFRVGSLLQASMVMLSISAVLPALGADAATEAVFIDPAQIKWQDAPPTLPKGAKAVVLSGDPGKEGPFVLRLKAPAGYRIPPHWHTGAEYLTIVSGAFYFGSGDKMDKAHEHAMKAGAFHYLPAKAHHYAYTKETTVVQVQGNGPFDINYVNDADDPQKAARH